MKRLFLAALLAGSLTAHAATDPATDIASNAVPNVAPDAALKAAIDDSGRSAASKTRDAARHPYETLTFFGIKPGMTVVELAPGAGWYTEILAPYLRDQGRLIAAGNDPKSNNAGARRAAARFQAKLDANPGAFDKVQLGVFEPPANINYAPKGSADLVLTFRNIHNWVPAGDATLHQLFTGVYDSLKPGGIFGVVEHRLPAGQEQDARASSGYLHQSYVIKLIEGAGFKLAATSEINANGKDKANHKGGVWALPPSYTNQDVDRARYAAIGESDRMTLKFVKPR
jgi:predicted methyltransferase